MEADDIEIDQATCDVVIELGDFSVVKSDQQHVDHILRADIGQFRQHPLTGAGLQRLEKGPLFKQELLQLINRQLTADNYNVIEVAIANDGQISINAERIL